MIYFDGTYRLPGCADSKATPREKWAYAWRVRIINLSISRPEVRHLRPFIVYVSPIGDGIFKTNCVESLGKKICRDFSLNIHETLWMEYLPSAPEQVYVAVFTPKIFHGPDFFFSIDWRSIRAKELELIKAFIPEIKTPDVSKPI